jgi:hypothetical protein
MLSHMSELVGIAAAAALGGGLRATASAVAVAGSWSLTGSERSAGASVRIVLVVLGAPDHPARRAGGGLG